MICTDCNDPRICYTELGVGTWCTCGGRLFAKDQDITAAPSWKKDRNLREGRLKLSPKVRTFTRFRPVQSTIIFECGCCSKLCEPRTMMRFDDVDSVSYNGMIEYDWCGRCVKKEIKFMADSRAEWKKIWALVKIGAKVEEGLASDGATKRVGEAHAANVHKFKPRVKMKLPPQPDVPAPELTLVL